MGKVLILLNGAGLILNVFIFLIVVHYFESVEGQEALDGTAVETVSKSDFTQLASTVQRELQKLNTSSAQKMSSEFTKVLAELGRLKSQVSSLDTELKKLMEPIEEEATEPAENGEAEGTTGTDGAAAPAPEDGSSGAE